MKSLRKGKARTELTEGLAKLAAERLRPLADQIPVEMGLGTAVRKAAQLQAAVLGGAIVETCKDMAIDEEIFFRYTNENLWRLTRALEASGLLEKAGE